MIRGLPLAERLRAKVEVDPETGCHNWTDKLSANGYGSLSVGGQKGKDFRAHRLAYEEARGPIPAGLTIDHLCRNKRCCNPDHMEAVTAAENTRRGSRCRDTSCCPKGHFWTRETTYYHGDGKRRCLPCRQARDAGRGSRPKTSKRGYMAATSHSMQVGRED